MNLRPVIGPLCDFNLNSPTSAIRSQMTISPSVPPLASRVPSREKVIVVIDFLCPLNVITSVGVFEGNEGVKDHSRIDPSLYDTAEVRDGVEDEGE
jgi:hypothetical protein